MTLKNLLGISLDAVPPDAVAIGKLLAAAQRNIGDAQLAGLSAENRFDAAYRPSCSWRWCRCRPMATAR